MIRSRYTDLPEVSFLPSDLPAALADLYDLACEWCLSDANEVEELAASKSRVELQSFLDRFFSNQDVIEGFVSQGVNQVPVPDGVVIVDLAFQAYDLLFAFSDDFKPAL